MHVDVCAGLTFTGEALLDIYWFPLHWRALHGQNSFGLSLSLSENRSSVNIALPAKQCSYACKELGNIIGCQRLLVGHGTNKAQKVPKGIL